MPHVAYRKITIHTDTPSGEIHKNLQLSSQNCVRSMVSADLTSTMASARWWDPLFFYSHHSFCGSITPNNFPTKYIMLYFKEFYSFKRRLLCTHCAFPFGLSTGELPLIHESKNDVYCLEGKNRKKGIIAPLPPNNFPITPSNYSLPLTITVHDFEGIHTPHQKEDKYSKKIHLN